MDSGSGVDQTHQVADILNPRWKYISANSTDLRETFKRVRERQEKEAKETAKVVKPLIRGKVNGT